MTEIPINATIKPSPVTAAAQGEVLKGTRLTTMDPRTGGDIYLFYQWDDGGIRYISQNVSRIWQGNINLEITDAKKGSPLASVSTGANGSTFVSRP